MMKSHCEEPSIFIYIKMPNTQKREREGNGWSAKKAFFYLRPERFSFIEARMNINNNNNNDNAFSRQSYLSRQQYCDRPIDHLTLVNKQAPML